MRKEVISDYERQRHLNLIEKENEKRGDAAEAQASEAVEKKDPTLFGPNKDVELDESITCPDCGAPEGEDHAEGCPFLTEGAPVEFEEMEHPEEISSEEAGEAADKIEETLEEDLAPMPEEETPEPEAEGPDCYGTFEESDEDCQACDIKDKCIAETVPKEEASVSEEEGLEEEGDFQCKKCQKFFDEPKVNEDNKSYCPHCGEWEWF